MSKKFNNQINVELLDLAVQNTKSGCEGYYESVVENKSCFFCKKKCNAYLMDAKDIMYHTTIIIRACRKCLKNNKNFVWHRLIKLSEKDIFYLKINMLG